MDDSNSNMDDSDSDDYEWVSNIMELIRSNQNNLFTSALLATKYYITYVDKKEVRTLGAGVLSPDK